MQGERKLPTVQWTARPASDDRLYYPVVWPRRGVIVRGWCVNDQLTGVLTHWIKQQTVGCLGHPDVCTGCQMGLVKRWVGFVPILSPSAGRIAIAQVSKEAARNHARLMDERPRLRGTLLILERTGQAANGRVVATLNSDRPATNLPNPFDVQPFLMRLWGWSPLPCLLPTSV